MKSYRMIFSYLMEIKSLKPDFENGIFSTQEILRIICNDGIICDIYTKKNNHKLWSEKLTDFWGLIYSIETYSMKIKLSSAFTMLIHTGYELSLKIYNELALICTQTAWLRSYYFERQGSVIMILENQKIPVYISLYRFCLIIEKESLRELVDILQLKFAILKEDPKIDDQTFQFQIRCYNKDYTFQTNREYIHNDWMHAIDHIIKLHHGLNDAAEVHEDPVRYYYSVSLQGKLSLKFSNGTTIPLKKSGPWIIGRASVNDVVLKYDEISRNHCKIELINNVPHLLDLGSRHGTQLNSQRIKISAPLKPGDVIQIANVHVSFEGINFL